MSELQRIRRSYSNTLLSDGLPVAEVIVLALFSLTTVLYEPAIAGLAFGVFSLLFAFAIAEGRTLHIAMLGGIYYLFRFNLIEVASPFRSLSDLIFVLSGVAVLVLLVRNKARLRFYDWIFFAWALYALALGQLRSIPLLPTIIQLRAMLAIYPLFILIRELGFGASAKRATLGLRFYELLAWWLFAQAFMEKASSKILFTTAFTRFTAISETNWPRVYGWAANPNSLGAVCVLLIALGVLLAAYGWRTQSLDRSLALYFSTLVLSVSRSALWGLAVFVAVIAIFKGIELLRGRDIWQLVRRPFTVGLATALIAVTLGMVTPLVMEALADGSAGFGIFGRFITDEDELDKSVNTGRLFSLRTAVELATTDASTLALGNGPATYGSAGSAFWLPPHYETYGVPEGFYADFFYGMMLVEMGLLGSVLYLGGLLAVFWSNRTMPRSWRLGIAALFALWCLFYNVTEIHMVFLLIMLLGGVPIPRPDLGQPDPQERPLAA
ncbi:MAG: hypothetical protein U1E08_01185 [Coriobacteriia bacterium]|nr:hypothetical protein [Coriobacteriia bacterium]